jgi:hypothetical protein
VVRRALAVALAGALAACTEPRLVCRVGDGPSRAGGGYAASYRLVHASAPACAGLRGDVFGLELYPADADAVAPRPRTLALATARLASLAAEAAAAGPDFADARHPLVSFGDLDGPEPDARGACAARSTSPAEQDLRALPPTVDDATGATTPGRAAVHLRQRFHDVRVLVTAAHPGTALRATLEHEDVTAGCTATYDVLAVWPAVSAYTFDVGTCQALRARDDGAYEPIFDANGDAVADPALCRAEAHPDERGTFGAIPGASYALGSGLDPSFEVACRNLGPSLRRGEALLACVLARVPSGLD